MLFEKMQFTPIAGTAGTSMFGSVRWVGARRPPSFSGGWLPRIWGNIYYYYYFPELGTFKGDYRTARRDGEEEDFTKRRVLLLCSSSSSSSSSSKGGAKLRTKEDKGKPGESKAKQSKSKSKSMSTEGEILTEPTERESPFAVGLSGGGRSLTGRVKGCRAVALCRPWLPGAEMT